MTSLPTNTHRKNERGQRRSHAARLTTRKAAPLRRADGGKQVRGAAVRERVLHAAMECFGAFGFEGASTRAVADRAGISHTRLLYHFGSKEKLWQSTMKDVIERYCEDLAQRLALVDRKDAAACLRAFIESFVRFSAQTPQLHRIMTQESTQGSKRIHWLIDAHLRESFNDVCRLIKRGQAQGRVRRGDAARLYYAIIGLGGTLLSVSSEFKALTGRDVFAEAELRQTIATICEFLFI